MVSWKPVFALSNRTLTAFPFHSSTISATKGVFFFSAHTAFFKSHGLKKKGEEGARSCASLQMECTCPPKVIRKQERSPSWGLPAPCAPPARFATFKEHFQTGFREACQTPYYPLEIFSTTIWFWQFLCVILHLEYLKASRPTHSLADFQRRKAINIKTSLHTGATSKGESCK